MTAAPKLLELHIPRTRDALLVETSSQLAEALGGTSFAVFLFEDGQQRARVCIAHGDTQPLRLGGLHRVNDWPESRLRLPLNYGGGAIGELQLDAADLEDGTRDAISTVLANFTVALVNLTLSEETRRTNESYCATLMALEEGVVLFQEKDPDAITARFLDLATTMMKAQAGALFVLEEVGQLESELRMVQVLGLPEHLFDGLQTNEGQPWPHACLNRPAQYSNRNHAAPASATFAGLDPSALPAALTNLAILPLAYHGVTAGLVVLCNCECPESDPEKDPEATAAEDVDRADLDGQRQLDRMKSLGELGAALMHRISLESINLRSQTVDTQLQIAANIQSRLQPREAPATPHLECAWSTVAAQNIGGDYLDLLASDQGNVLAIVADAAGHGIDSALLMSSFRAAWRAHSPTLTPGVLLATLNEEIAYEVGSTGMFITAATLNIHKDGRGFTMSSAGHNDIYVYRSATNTVEVIDSDGPPLGFMSGMNFPQRQHALAPGDVIVLYTDGIVEATGHTDRDAMFGDDRLKELLIKHGNSSAADILSVILDEFASFTGGAAQEDDCSVTVLVSR